MLLKQGQNGSFTIRASAPMATGPVEVMIAVSDAPALVWRNGTSHRFDLHPSDAPEEYVLAFTVDPRAPPQRLTLTLSMTSGNQTVGPQWTIYVAPPEVASTMTAGGRNVPAHFAFLAVIGLAAAAGLSRRSKR
jgi:MYXO-CTERM domain-containing protein